MGETQMVQYFYKTTGLYSSKMSYHEAQRQTKEVFQIKEH